MKLDLNETKGLISSVIRQQGKEIPFYVLFLKIPDNQHNPNNTSDNDFNTCMSEQCQTFMDAICSILKSPEQISNDPKSL